MKESDNLVDTWAGRVKQYLETHYQGKAVRTETIKADISKGVSTHKRDIGSDPFPNEVDPSSSKRSSASKKTIGSATFSKGTSTHKRDIGSGPFSNKVWKDAIRLFLKDNSEWERKGHALIKAGHKAGLKAEEEAVA